MIIWEEIDDIVICQSHKSNSNNDFYHDVQEETLAKKKFYKIEKHQPEALTSIWCVMSDCKKQKNWLQV